MALQMRVLICMQNEQSQLMFFNVDLKTQSSFPCTMSMVLNFLSNVFPGGGEIINSIQQKLLIMSLNQLKTVRYEKILPTY